MRSDAVLERNPGFRLEDGNGSYAFVDASGFRVETDLLGKLVWDALPGTPSGIAEKVAASALVPRGAMETFIEVMGRSGLAGVAGTAWPNLPLPLPAGGGETAPRPDLVSVVVTTYNGLAHVDACFRSIVRQTHPRIEIIAVDNASTDGTVGRIRAAYPQVEIVALRRNLHYTGGVNAGAARARGEYLLILNQDTELDPRCVARLLERAAADPTIGAVAPAMRFFQLRGMINGIGNQIWNRSWGSDNYIGHVDVGQFGGLDELPSACFGAVFLRRSAFEEVGPLDRGYGSFYEDVDWSFRCWFSGRRIVAAPGAVVYHKFGGSYLSRPKLRFVARNRQRLVLKLFQGKVRPGVFRRYLQEDVRSVLSSVKRREWGMAWAYAAAYASLAARIPEILLKRRGVMRRKRQGIRELDVFRRNLVYYHCLTPEGRLRLDTSVLLGYYRWVIGSPQKAIDNPGPVPQDGSCGKGIVCPPE
jgi:GT2 family glycosyltransferase